MLTMSDLSLEYGKLNSEVTGLRQRLEHSPRFHARLLDAVQEAVIATDLTGRVLYWNRFAEALYGWSAEEALGRNVLELKAACNSQAEAEKVLETVREGGTWSGEIVLRRKDGTTFPAHVSDAPLQDGEGDLIGIVEISYDITPRKAAEQKQILLIRELHHRVKNTLCIVQAIMSTTARSTLSVQEFQDAFMGRVAALAKTHVLLTEDQSQSASFLDLLRGELEPYYDGTGRRIILEGPQVLLPSDIAVPLGMAVHELTTNAAKHGALREPKGSVVVRWNEIKQDQRYLSWDWNEHNGPPVELPNDEGFGTQLVYRLLTAQTGAEVRIDFDPGGLHVFVSVPLKS
jgi:PAS domain S-box-containing protein